MKAIRALLVPAIAAWGLAAATDVPAQAVNGATRAAPSGSTGGSLGRHFGGQRSTGTHGGHHGHHGGRWHGHHGHHGHHHHRFHSHFGFFFGVPLAWSAWHWGWPYYYDSFYYPYPRVIYREVERGPEYREGEVSAPPSAEVQPTPGSPTQGPLYMNYCESAKAYYPKVTSCPEGWKFIAPKS